MGPSKEVKKEFVEMLFDVIKKAFPKSGIEREQIELSISIPKEENGDMSSFVAFRIAKSENKAPHQIAEVLLKSMKPKKLISKISELNGYLNGWINEAEYSKLVIESALNVKEKYVSSTMGGDENVIVEFPSVNPNKPWHVGHLKAALLGDSISRIMGACAYNVERADYIDDLGLQMAEILWGHYNIEGEPDKKYDQWLGERYVEINKRINEEKSIEKKSIEEQIKDLLIRMEDQKSRESKEVREIAETSVKAQYETAFEYGIYHNVLIFESDIVRERLLEKALELIKKKGITEVHKEGKYKGCIVIDLEKVKGIEEQLGKQEEMVKVLVRSNGAATYLAKDLAFHMWKFGLIKSEFKFKPFIKQPNGEFAYVSSASGEWTDFGDVSRVVNVIGSAQAFPQLLLKAIFNLLGHEELSDNLMHLSYGEVSIEGGSLSGRTGGWIGDERNYTADDLLAEVKEKAVGIVKESEKLEDKTKVDEIAKAVAIGAIKFEFLRVAPEKRVVFSWQRALNFESNSGPYCMYTYARAQRILERAGYKNIKLLKEDYEKVSRGYEFELIKKFGSAGEVVEKACNEYRPSVIADYISDLATLFSKFYETMPVIKGGEAKNMRLSIVASTKYIIGSMLELLGIMPIEAM